MITQNKTKIIGMSYNYFQQNDTTSKVDLNVLAQINTQLHSKYERTCKIVINVDTF